MINFEINPPSCGSNDLEVFACCGTTCDKAKSIQQVTDLQTLNANVTGQLALMILTTHFLGTKLENGVYPDLGGTEDLLNVLANIGGLDYIKTDYLLVYISEFRKIWERDFYET